MIIKRCIRETWLCCYCY